MLNSVWNLCRSCPVPTDEKPLHTEYKRSFTWHSNPDDVVQKPPESDRKMEPAISRKKKYPDLAYKHEFILCNGDDGVESSESQDTGSGSGGDYSEQGTRARPVERITKGSFRSKSADPGLERRIKLMVQSYPPSRLHRNPTLTGDAPIVPKATEYRSKFAWPGDGPELTEAHRIAYSGLKLTEDRSSDSQEGQNGEEQTSSRKREKRTEYKSNFRPFSSYVYVDGNWKKTHKLRDAEGKLLDETNPWYSEVVERIKKADEYRVRSQGTPFYGEQSPLIQGKPVEGDSPLSTDVLIAMSRPLFREEKPISPRKRSVSAHPPAVVPLLQTGESRQKEESLSSSRSVSSERKKERTPEGRHETSPRRQPRTFREGLSTKKPVRPASVPRGEPSIKSTGTTTPPYSKPRPVPRQSPYSTVNGEDTKLWVKPTTADQEKKKDIINGEKLEKYFDEGDGVKEPLESEEKGNHEMPLQTKEKDTVRPSFLQETNGFNGDAESKSPSPIPEPPTGPVPLTTVMSPEELTGVKSPVPETWTVPLETKKELEWTNCYTAA
ncbi:uncharacterized protein LOC106457196 isoform X2 [Limulus polyphemus]|nr:uncharacterized protein LOC106457196 isoform X2 [Limulus polyphemus]